MRSPGINANLRAVGGKDSRGREKVHAQNSPRSIVTARPLEKLAKLPIWAFHGDADPLVPVERPRDMIAAIKKAGGEPKYTEYKGVGHDAWTPTYRDNKVLDWLFEQKKGK